MIIQRSRYRNFGYIKLFGNILQSGYLHLYRVTLPVKLKNRLK
jgi:hypothetical protein